MTELTFWDVKRKARYGHRDWLCWTDRKGTKRNERKTSASMKQCLLDSGTQGFWCLVCANDGVPLRGSSRDIRLRELPPSVAGLHAARQERSVETALVNSSQTADAGPQSPYWAGQVRTKSVPHAA